MKDLPSLCESTMEKNETQYALVILAEARLALGDLHGARSLAAEARRALFFNLSWKVAVDCLDAQIAIADREPSLALQIAASWLREPSEIPYAQARIHEVAAQAHSAMRERELALNEARTARDIYAKLGAVSRLHSVDSFIAAATHRKPGRPHSSLPGRLTSREIDVLRSLVKGKTNSEIASTLFIGTGTVKKHIENIKTKLGARRRSELAAFAVSLFSGPNGVSDPEGVPLGIAVPIED